MRLDELMDPENSADVFFDKLRASPSDNNDERHINYLRSLMASNSSGSFSLWKLKNNPNKYVLWKKFSPHAWYDFEVCKLIVMIKPTHQ